MNNLDREGARRRIRRVIDRLTNEGSAVADLDGCFHSIFPVAASPEEGESLRSWVTREDARRTIEVGLGYGVSTMYICDALAEYDDPRASHVAIDPYQNTRFANCALQFLDEAGIRHKVEHLDEESQIVLPRLLGQGRRFDLAFVDGNHRFDRVFLDVVYLGRLLPPGAIVFVDDYQLPSVAKAVSFCLTNLNWSLEERSSVDGRHHWAVLRTNAQSDVRSFDYFVEF
ncbi:MAG: class I SAM-dependent methyltransferase [Acidimicrobiales bacterium]